MHCLFLHRILCQQMAIYGKIQKKRMEVFMREFFESTAWPMQKPEPYGAFHLVFTFVGLAVAVLLAYLLRKTNEKQNRAVLLVRGVFLCACEADQQMSHYYVTGHGAYPWWIFPLEL